MTGIKEFIPIEDLHSKSHVGKSVSIRGWVYRQRATKDFVFLVIRDSTGIIQCTVKSSSKNYKSADKALIESSVRLTGKLKKDKRAPTGYEIDVRDFHIIGKSDRFPITRDQSTEFLLDVRHLWLRSQKMTAIMKIRSTVFDAIHEYFSKRGYYEFQPPLFTPAACEGGSTLFEVEYFGKKAYLSQSWQLYAEAAVYSLEKIYTISPSFRAERSRTTRHLTEYWHAETEIAWAHLRDLEKVAEELVSHICQKVAKDRAAELKRLGRDPEDLKKIKPPFPKITYTKALKILKKDKMTVKWGKDLRTLEERALAKHYDKPLIITEYPKEIMAFYKPPKHGDEKVALCFDMLCPELGSEIIGGSERDLDIERMKKYLKKQGDDPRHYEWYFDTRRYGAVPHSGFGLGVERVVAWLCKLDDIKDAIPFPRTMDRFSP
jgi:asparaginyl-tRNA synthetase